MWLSKASMKRPVLTIVAVLVVLALGGVSLTKLELDLIPDINPPVGAVVANYSGAGPEEVLEKVTKPLEKSLSTLSGLNTLQTQTREGNVLLLLEFDWAEDVETKQNDILSRINQANLPDDVPTPTFIKFDPSSLPIIQLSVVNKGDADKLREEIDDIVQQLTNLSGVASVNESGLLDKQIHVTLKADEMKKYGLSQQNIRELLQSHQLSQPGGIVHDGENDLTTRVIGEIPDVDTMKKLTVTADPTSGKKVTLGDVAKVKMAEEEKESITRTNLEPSIGLNVFKQSGANTAKVSAAVRDKIDQLNDKGKIEIVPLFDQGVYVEESIGNVSTALISGGILAMLVLFLFLRSFGSPLMIGVAIPLSVIVTFVLMFFSDFSLNIMTLGGLALGVGMLVDNAIVVIENTYRHLNMGKPPKQAAVEGAGEVAAAITASTLTTLAVFLPIVFVSGIVGNIFREFAFTVSFSLFASLLVSLTIVPVMAGALLKKPNKNREAARQRSNFFRGYRALVEWALHHRKTVLTVSLALLVAGLAGIWSVGSEFLPPTDEGIFVAEVEMPEGTGLAKTEEVTKKIEKVLADEKDVADFQASIGDKRNQGLRQGGRNTAQIFVRVVDLDQRDRSTNDIMNDVRREVATIDKQATLTFKEQSAFEMGSAPNTLQFLVSGDEEKLNKQQKRITDSLEKVKHVKEVTNSEVATTPELRVAVDRDKARENGLVPAQVVSAVSDAIRGDVVTRVNDDDNKEVGVLVRYEASFAESPDKLKKLPLTGSEGNTTLDKVADVAVADGPTTINRRDLKRAIEYKVQFQGTSLGEVEQAVKQKLDDLDLPDSLRVQFIGASEVLEDAKSDLSLAFVLSLLLVFLVLAAQFESFKYPFVIFFSLPLMVIGIGIGLFAMQIPLSVTAMIGLIVLAGIVVNNAIVMVDFINRLKKRGETTYDAIVTASATRLRPILMTTLTTILGLVPSALALGEGTEIQQPLAVVVIGGLLSSTLLTLVVIPVMYSWFDPETRHGYTYHPARPPRGYRFAAADGGLTLPVGADVRDADAGDMLVDDADARRGRALLGVSYSDAHTVESVKVESVEPVEPLHDGDDALDGRWDDAEDERQGDASGLEREPRDTDRRSDGDAEQRPRDTVRKKDGDGTEQHYREVVREKDDTGRHDRRTRTEAKRRKGGPEAAATAQRNVQKDDEVSQEEMLDLMSRMLEMAKKLPREGERREPKDD